MRSIKYSVLSAVLAATMLMLTSCTGDMNDNRSSSPGNIPSEDNNGHISSAEGVLPGDIISSVEDFVSDITSDVTSTVSDVVG